MNRGHCGRGIVGNRHLIPGHRGAAPQTCEGATRTEHDTIVAVEAYLYENLTNPVQSSRLFFFAMQSQLSISQIIGASTRVPFLVSNCNYPYRPGFLIFRM